jgi:hypothetical protein
MPILTTHSLQVIGDDPDGSLTELVLLLGLKNIPHLESISLNMSQKEKLTETFIRQITADSSIRRVKILFPPKVTAKAKMINGLAMNEHIQEISMVHNPEEALMYPVLLA